MGLFDRFRSAGQAADEGKNKAATSEQEALRLIDEGNVLEAKGQADEAMQHYLEAIRLAPTLARAHLNLGNILLAKGDLKGALEAFKTAIRYRPDYAGAYYNMGNALLSHGQYNEAVTNYRQALEIKPDYAEVHCVLGIALKELGQMDDAVASYRRALEIKPDFVEAYSNLGIILEHLFNTGLALLNEGKPDAAIENFLRVLKIEPKLADAHYHLGNAQKKLGQDENAVNSYRRALELKPGYAEAHNNLGVVLHDLGRYEEAVASYRRALELKPDYAEAHSNLGAALKEQGKLSEAAASYRRALELKPDFADAYSNLGVVLYDLGQHKEAMENYRLALEINPDLAVANSNLGSALKEQGKFVEADACYKRALKAEPDNAIFRVAQMFNLPLAPQTVEASAAVPGDFDRSLQDLSDWMLAAPAQRQLISEALSLQATFYLAYRDGNHVERLSRFGDLLAACSLQARIGPLPERKKLRLVVVSNYFRRHSVWDVILRGILVNLDRTRFEVLLYNTGNIDDGETKLARSLSDGWRDFHTVAGLNGWLEAMAADRPDAIFYPEIGMDQMTLHLATRRLAPLQAASWGHPITSGLPEIDMYFSGELLEAPDADTHYRERLVRLPGTGCCTKPIELKPEALPQLAADLASRRGPRFVIAQTPYKFDPAHDGLFARIAAAVGECTFILVSDPQFQWAMERLIDRLKRSFVELGLDPEKYLLVIQWVPREKFYTLLDLSDIFLDCLSFSGYTTAWQAVQRGLPVLTLEGKFMRQRLAAGLLRKIGMTDTIASSVDDYVEIAVQLAAECREPERRNARRSALKAAAPLADNDVSVVRAFERSLIEALAEKGRHFKFETAAQSNSTPPNSNKA